MRISDWSSDVCSSDLVGQLHHDEERLLERVFDGSSYAKYLVETFLDELRHFERMEGGFLDADRNAAHPSRRRLVRQKRSEERRVGKECVGTGRSRWSP